MNKWRLVHNTFALVLLFPLSVELWHSEGFDGFKHKLSDKLDEEILVAHDIFAVHWIFHLAIFIRAFPVAKTMNMYLEKFFILQFCGYLFSLTSESPEEMSVRT
jgi:hypothetical protein